MSEIEIIVIFSLISFITSFITSIASVGGGMIMLASLGQFFSPSVLIPLHAFIQISNNLSRAYLFRKYIVYEIFKTIAIGSLIGSIVGILFFSLVPEEIILSLIGVFILWMVFFKAILRKVAHNLSNGLCGLLAAAVGMVVGANGPVVSAFLATKDLTSKELIATHGAIMVCQHLFKIIAFITLFQFVLKDFLLLIVFTTFTGFFGAWSAKKFLDQIPQKIFEIGLKSLLLILAVTMIIRGVGQAVID
ncbi:MAG: sulfite exporter TauE/SafE family protein [Gammaproteobacteria bacterium]